MRHVYPVAIASTILKSRTTATTLDDIPAAVAAAGVLSVGYCDPSRDKIKKPAREAHIYARNIREIGYRL